MEAAIHFISDHAHAAPWIFFLLLMLAGINVPISEDLLLMAGGMIVSTCCPEDTFRMFLWLYFGCVFSAWEAYWLGRGLGPKLYEIRWFRRILSRKRMKRLNRLYEKYGVWTFVVGRFIPGGVRNCLFMTAGLGKMDFKKFVWRDSFACIFSASFLYFLGYSFGQNWETIYRIFRVYHFWSLFALGIGGCLLLLALFFKKRVITEPKA